MLRSIKSAQRKIRIIALKINGDMDVVSGPDAKHVKFKKDSNGAILAGELEMKVPFATDSEVVIIRDEGSAGTVSVSGKDLTVTGGAASFLVIGSDTPEQY